MTRLSSLPAIMVAPNGARRGKADHPALPVTIAETVAAAKACHDAGAGALHAHVRDGDGNHVLDAGLYAELLAEMARVVPDMAVQITTEAVGRYTPAQQRALMGALHPDGISIGLREMLADGQIADARRAYHAAAEAGISVQHILYAPEDVSELAAQIKAGVIPQTRPQVIFVLGRYTSGQQSDPADLAAYLAKLAQLPAGADWALC
ncbi:MAG: 3-keto-5-aminohexanoate cleavage protein, partial [Paracoccaceae bacterium]|nr:3-keto-5-aminohexanoate cleavage protein [Paracoccaceae bacterium]